MRSCVYCKRRYKENSEISFHRFPKDLKERKIWLQNMNITNCTPKKFHCLCSLHFNEECFDKHFNRIKLKPGSIPTIFEGTSTLPSTPCSSTLLPCPSISTLSPRPSTSPSTTKSANIGLVPAKRKLICNSNITELSDKLKRDQERLTDHDYEFSSTTKKARIVFGLLHDHHYDITPRSSKK